MSAHQIHTAIREALAHERTAGKAEDQYAMKMKAAGASMFHAFSLACAAAPELRGRKLDDKAMTRLYLSTTPRPWWDAQLVAAKCTTDKGLANRDAAKRLIQWHLDPKAAQARRAQHVISTLAGQKRLEKQRTTTARGSTLNPKRVEIRTVAETARLDHHAARITAATETAALAGRELPVLAAVASTGGASMNALFAEVTRISNAARKIELEYREAALDILRTTARELEELC